ncbi:MAG: hypothetical protein B6243_07400 [Anaerolineaceae bacterium 4572_5.2]|nr:MAG: hypothetical protein B6243_07400 [Anaerolineaceae bacterium 4572_5.2]
MELRQYWRIIKQRIWIPLVLALVVAGISVFTAKTPAPSYTASLRFVVSVEPERVEGQFNYDGYYAGISSEFIADDLSEIVRSQAFTEDVNRHLNQTGSALQIAPGALSGITFADKHHRILQINITWPNPNELQELGEAIAQAVEEDSAKYLKQFSAFGSVITIIDRPLGAAQIPPSLTQKLDLPLRLILALLAGIGLTFLLHYLDTSVRSAKELEELGIVVLAEIPK